MNKIHFDVTVVGGGIVALTSAIECANRGLSVALVCGDQTGIASTAAAGMLAPSIEPAPGAAGRFAFLSRDYYPEFVAELERQTQVDIPLRTNGIIEIIGRAKPVAPLASSDAKLISPDLLPALEPGLRLAADKWSVLHSRDGWVNNVSLIAALWTRVRQLPRIHEFSQHAVSLRCLTGEVRVQLIDATGICSSKTVIAAGAWVNSIAGLPTRLPVEPWRGQMLAVGNVSVNHVVIGEAGYIVPRLGDIALLGGTMENVGFDVQTTDDGIAEVRRAAGELSSSLVTARELSRWAGLRPMTPDALPIIGADRLQPSLIYACGHSRNGILLGPLTGRCVAALAADAPPPADLSPFSLERFGPPSARMDSNRH